MLIYLTIIIAKINIIIIITTPIMKMVIIIMPILFIITVIYINIITDFHSNTTVILFLYFEFLLFITKLIAILQFFITKYLTLLK